MPILGSGLVTAEGDLWLQQRSLIGPALRTEMLDEVRVYHASAQIKDVDKCEPCHMKSACCMSLARRTVGDHCVP